MDAQKAVEGREVPEEEVGRAGVSPVSQSFQAREAGTVTVGTRRRRGAQAGKPAPPETDLPERSFQVREAGTVTLTPPHWQGLVEVPPAVKQEIEPAGIPSAEAFGIPTIIQVTGTVDDPPAPTKSEVQSCPI
ncbi:MAG: hypothetical protein C4567_12450 [Deltaproteobacteria bacterium]|nr:MAG: hypothetical protein C4567_12450 [Deltaproteobacteria bacterium]